MRQTSKKLSPKKPKKVNARVLWFTEPEDMTTEEYPELYYHLTDDVEWNLCTDIRQLRAECEKNDLIFIDGGCVGDKQDRILNKIIADMPNKQFIMSGYLASKWYSELCDPAPNLDTCCWSHGRDYVRAWIERNKV